MTEPFVLSTVSCVVQQYKWEPSFAYPWHCFCLLSYSVAVELRVVQTLASIQQSMSQTGNTTEFHISKGKNILIWGLGVLHLSSQTRF